MTDFITKYWSQLLALLGFLSGAFGFLWNHIRKTYKTENEIQNERLDKLEGYISSLGVSIQTFSDVLKVLLKDRLIQTCKHHIKKGYFPLREREVALSMFENLVHLKGNGNNVVKNLLDDALRLPTSQNKTDTNL